MADLMTDDNYHLWIPIEDSDDELLKSVQVDENGDYIVQGVMTSDDNDEEDDSISPDGMDCSYFLTKGWIKYEHGNSPKQFIGEPLEVKVGQFEHPTLKKSVNGIHVKGRLFAQRALTKEAVSTIQDLQKSHTSRRMGWSIEGNVKERDRKTGKIVKSVLRNVVLTMNPVNTVTWAELAKSFAKNHEVEVDCVDKSLDVGGEQSLARQSLEGAPRVSSDDDYNESIARYSKLFKKFLKRTLRKRTRKSFVTSRTADVELFAYDFAVEDGLDYEGASQFATYIAERHEILKSLLSVKIGGETMSKLAELLDTDLEELRKSLELTEEDTEDGEELEKGVQTEGNDEGDESDHDGDEGEDTEDDEEDEEDEDGDDDEGEDDDEEGDEDTEKSLRTDFAKSLAKGESGARAFEVSDFLTDLVDEIGFHMDGFEKSMGRVTKQQNTIAKSLLDVAEIVKSLNSENTVLREEVTELRKSLDEVLERPVGRRSAVNTREVNTITKGMETGLKPANTGVLTRGKILDVLNKSFDAGELQGSEILRFEGGTPLNQLKLPASVKEQLGL